MTETTSPTKCVARVRGSDVFRSKMSFDGRELLFARQGRSTGFDLWRLASGAEAAPLWTEPGYQATASLLARRGDQAGAACGGE